VIGLIFLTEATKLSDKANPANNMYLGSQERLKAVLNDFCLIVERIRPRTELERVAEASKIGEQPEWSPDGIFKRLSDRKMG